MSQTNVTHPTNSDSEGIPNYNDEEEEDSLSDASTVCTRSNKNQMDIEAFLKISQRRMEKLDLFVALFVRVASRIKTMSKEEMEANRRLNSKNDT